MTAGARFLPLGWSNLRMEVRVLPPSDLTAILDVLVSVGAQVAADELDPALADRLGRRLRKHGLLGEVSPGELNAVIADLCRRVHWAMGDGSSYPAAAARVTVYRMRFGDVRSAREVVAWVEQSGGGASLSGGSDSWEVAATYPDLWPSAEFEQRVASLTQVASEHGGSYTGAGD